MGGKHNNTAATTTVMLSVCNSGNGGVGGVGGGGGGKKTTFTKQTTANALVNLADGRRDINSKPGGRKSRSIKPPNTE